ncbi:LRG1 Rho-GTPase-activating protein LRG1 [Candida maltosa Xu316]
MPGKPEPSYNSKDSLHQLKQNRDFVSDNYSRNIPTNNPFLFREKRSDLFPSKSSLDPSQRHSIAVSPTPEKQSSKNSMMPGSYQRPPINKDKSLEKKSTRKKSRKICAKCGLEISSQFVRALQSAYHVDCFTCHECGKQCSAKFFPYEIKSDEGTTKQVALCEYDYFKKLDLICFSCNSALRGPYITALGNKYHLEHFKCHVCQRVFDSDESYYEHNNNIYCHYHYSKLYASHCEGCQSSIVKQFVELFRGGRNQHWHPECYMVHKFWNVCITPDSVGLQKLYDLSDETLNSLKLLKDADDNSRSNIDSNTLVSIEQQIEQVVMRSWLALSGYEEMTAKCISDMLLYACTGNKFSGIVVTGKLVLNVEVLFNALDYVLLMCNSSTELLHEKYGSPHRVDDSESSSQEEEYFQMLKKEPRNITGKIMSYLAILRKSDHIAKSGSLSAELLSVITGCAHYLKLLIRIGLFNALKLNKLYGTTNAIEKFLQLTLEHEAINLMAGDELTQLSLINSKLTIPPSSTDACSACAKSIEKSCLRMNNNRWHIKCFICSGCDRLIPQSEAADTKFDLIHQSIICKHCYCEHYDVGFQVVSDLSQLIYLLKIALFRSRSVMKIDLAKVPKNYLSSEDDYQEGENEVEDNYSQTLNDVTSLRSKRQSQKLSKSVKKKARKSIIVEAPEADNAKKEEYKVSNEHTITEELNELSFDQPPPLTDTRKTSTASQLSFDKSENEKFVVSRKKSLKIRDEPQRQATNLQLDRTSDLLKNEKALTLDDIPRIVAAEQARDQRPNAFKHHNSLYQRQSAPHRLKTTGHHKSSSIVTPTNVLENILNSSSLPPAASDNMANENRPQKYYSELSKEEHFIVRHIAVDVLSRLDKFYNKDELMPLIQHKKHGNSGGTFWDKFRFGGASSDGKKDKTMAVFGVDLQMLTNKYGIDSDLGVGPSKLRIPIIVDDLIAALRQKDMSVEGIFRLNGNIKKLRELTEQINKNPLHSPDFSLQNAVQLAALMKKWLRELPDPLLTFGLYDYWISSQREQDPELKKKKVQLVYALLGRTNRNLLEVLLYFLSWVASFAVVDEETGSKMDILNLATVIAPNILISKSSSNSSASSGDNYFLAIEVVNQLIEQHEEFSIVPNEIMEIYEKCKFDSFLENHHHHHSGNSNSSKRITSKEVMTVLESQNNNST